MLTNHPQSYVAGGRPGRLNLGERQDAEALKDRGSKRENPAGIEYILFVLDGINLHVRLGPARLASV